MHDNNIHTLVFDLWKDTRDGIYHFLPESILCAVMVLLLLVRIVKWTERRDVFWLALGGTVAALLFTSFWTLFSEEIPRQELFTGMLVYDGFTVLLRGILIGFAVLFLLFSRLTRVPDKEERPDVFVLVLGATLGMCLMASANHMLTVFLAVEMASVPSYVLAGMLKGQRKSSEASLKYAVYGAGAAGVMLYGISLIAGITNTLHLPTMATELARLYPDMNGDTLMVAGARRIDDRRGPGLQTLRRPLSFLVSRCVRRRHGRSGSVFEYRIESGRAGPLGPRRDRNRNRPARPGRGDRRTDRSGVKACIRRLVRAGG